MKSNEKMIHGAEGIVVWRESVVLGVQKNYRWQEVNGVPHIVIKTIGGRIENDESSLQCLKREIMEELSVLPLRAFDDAFSFSEHSEQYYEDVSGIREATLVDPLSCAEVELRLFDLTSLKQEYDVMLHGIFYNLRVKQNVEIVPNDLPVLCVIPKDVFSSIDFSSNHTYASLLPYLIGDHNTIPNNAVFEFMIPCVVKKVLHI